jgi:hypothetical protein
MHKSDALATTGPRTPLLADRTEVALVADARLKSHVTVPQAAAESAEHLERMALQPEGEPLSAGAEGRWRDHVAAAFAGDDNAALIADAPRMPIANMRQRSAKLALADEQVARIQVLGCAVSSGLAPSHITPGGLCNHKDSGQPAS